MADRIIYLRDGRVHTGQLWDAAEELIEKDLAVISRIREGIKPITEQCDPMIQFLLLRTVMDPQTIPEKLRQSWAKTERSLTRLMVEAKLLISPYRTWNKLVERMTYTNSLTNTRQAEGFLNLSEGRISYLEDAQSRSVLGTQRWTQYVFAENLILRGGVCGRAYLLPASREVRN